MHLSKLNHFTLTWEGATDASGTVMGGICQYPEVQWFVWRSPFYSEMQSILVSDNTPKEGATINNLELAALLTQVHLSSPNMYTFSHICTSVDNTTAQVWANCGSIRSVMAVGPIIRYLALLTRNHNIYAPVQQIDDTNSKMASSASRLTHLTNKMFLHHFSLTFHQKNPWQLLTLPSGCRRRLTSMLHSKRCGMASQPHSSKKTPTPGANDASSANVWESQPTSKVLAIPYLSSRSSPILCAPAFWKPAGYSSRSGPWSGTFVTLGKYSQPWAPATPGATSWESSTFAWDNKLRPMQKKTLRLHESAPYPSLSSKPSTFTANEERTANMPSVTWPGYNYSFHSGQESAAGALSTPTTARSSSETSTFSSESSPSTRPWPLQAWTRKPGPTLSFYSSPYKKMVSRENPLATSEAAIPKSVRWQKCVTTSHKLNSTAPLALLILL